MKNVLAAVKAIGICVLVGGGLFLIPLLGTILGILAILGIVFGLAYHEFTEDSEDEH